MNTEPVRINNTRYANALRRLFSLLPDSDKSFIITGSTGLIGTCIIDMLALANRDYNRNFEVFALGRSQEKLEKRFGSITKTGNIYFLEQDITQPIALSKKVDYIIHAASNADPKSYAVYPAETILTNIIGARNVLDYCKEYGTKALLLSTFEVYGNLNQDTYTEEDFGYIDNIRLRACYPESKRSAELLFRSYADEYGVDCSIARLSSIYGPTMLRNDSKAHAQFLRNAIQKENIVLKSEGKQRRTYCYVIDAVGGLLTVLFKGQTAEAYNVANRYSICSISELANTIAQLSGLKVVYELPDDVEAKGFSSPQDCILETAKLEKLGWSGLYNLKDGLSETIEILKDWEL